MASKRNRRAAPPRLTQDYRLSVSLIAPRLPSDAARQNVASYAHRHGVVLTRKGEPVGRIAAVTLCRILRAAIENNEGERRRQAETFVRAVALGLQGQDGPLCVPVPLLDMLRRYGRLGVAPNRSPMPADAAAPSPDAKASCDAKASPSGTA